MKARLEAAKIQATPGQPFVVEVDITNTASVIDAFSARLTGLDPDWVTASATGLQIFPNEHRTIELTVELPSDFPSGLHRLGVVVQSALDQALDSRLPIEIEVTESGAYTARLEPPLLNGHAKGLFALHLANQGNALKRITVQASDENGLCQAEMSEPWLDLRAKEEGTLFLQVKGPRPWFGTPLMRTIQVEVDDGDVSQIETGLFSQKARITRFWTTMIGVLLAATTFGLVFFTNLDNLVQRTTTDPQLLEGAFLSGEPTTPGGSITASGRIIDKGSGEPIPNAIVRLYRPSDLAEAFASAVADNTGSFTLDGLPNSPTIASVEAAGYGTTWSGNTRSSANAQPITPDTSGESTALRLDFQLTGGLADVSGRLVGGAVGGIEVTLLASRELLGGEGNAVVGSTITDDSGDFAFSNVPAPLTAILRLRGAEIATLNVPISLLPGDNLQNLELQVRGNDATVTGTVRAGPDLVALAQVRLLGNDYEVSTLTLTDGPQRGSYYLGGVVAPGQYVLEVSHPGYATRRLNVDLDENRDSLNVDVELVANTHYLVGHAHGGPQTSYTGIGGLEVKLSGELGTFSSRTLSIGEPSAGSTAPEDSASTRCQDVFIDARGCFAFENIPVPGRYVLEVSGAGYETVAVDVFLTAETAGPLSINIPRTGVRVAGSITNPEDVRGRIHAVLSNAASRTEVFATNDCLPGSNPCSRGDFAFEDVTSGYWDLQISSDGFDTINNRIFVESIDINLADQTLISQGEISLRVCDYARSSDPLTACLGRALQGYRVFLWETSSYPATEPRVTLTDQDGIAYFDALSAPAVYTAVAYPPEADSPLRSMIFEIDAVGSRHKKGTVGFDTSLTVPVNGAGSSNVSIVALHESGFAESHDLLGASLQLEDLPLGADILLLTAKEGNLFGTTELRLQKITGLEADDQTAPVDLTSAVVPIRTLIMHLADPGRSFTPESLLEVGSGPLPDCTTTSTLCKRWQSDHPNLILIELRSTDRNLSELYVEYVDEGVVRNETVDLRFADDGPLLLVHQIRE